MIVVAFKNKVFPQKNSARFLEYGSEKDILSRSSISSDSEDELLKQHNERYKAISHVDNKLDSELIRK